MHTSSAKIMAANFFSPSNEKKSYCSDFLPFLGKKIGTNTIKSDWLAGMRLSLKVVDLICSQKKLTLNKYTGKKK